VSVGDALAQARSQAGLTIAQVSQRTCIRETIIRGIERGDFSACGGDFYARGHIRSIARVVGADPDELVREYDAAHGMPQQITAADVFQPATPIRLKERRSPNWSIAMVIVLAAVIGYGVVRVVNSGSPSHPVAASGAHSTSSSSSPSPSPTPSPSPSPTAQPGVVIHLTALYDCWVGFTRHGVMLFQVNVPGGTSRTWHFKHAIIMQVGNPDGIVLTVNGKKYRHPGAIGGPVTFSLHPGQAIQNTSAG
jgi:transcriptional regulator with XRE-family HTH domain